MKKSQRKGRKIKFPTKQIKKGKMVQLLEKEDYINLGVTDLMNKAAEVIKKRQEESKEVKRNGKYKRKKS